MRWILLRQQAAEATGRAHENERVRQNAEPHRPLLLMDQEFSTRWIEAFYHESKAFTTEDTEGECCGAASDPLPVDQLLITWGTGSVKLLKSHGQPLRVLRVLRGEKLLVA
jgi:hypothetical protein